MKIAVFFGQLVTLTGASYKLGVSILSRRVKGDGWESVSFCVDSYCFGSTEAVKYGTWLNIFR